jgi:hypothetical protein
MWWLLFCLATTLRPRTDALRAMLDYARAMLVAEVDSADLDGGIMRTDSWMMAGMMTVAVVACQSGDLAVGRTPASEGASSGGGGGGSGSGGGVAPASLGGWAEALRVETRGWATGKNFAFVCAGPSAKGDAGPGAVKPVVTEAPPRITIACKDPKTGYVLTFNLVDPKVGKMDVSPNAGASVITFDAGLDGVATSTNGATHAGLDITAWDPAGGHRAAKFGMGWYANQEMKTTGEGSFEGALTL